MRLLIFGPFRPKSFPYDVTTSFSYHSPAAARSSSPSFINTSLAKGPASLQNRHSLPGRHRVLIFLVRDAAAAGGQRYVAFTVFQSWSPVVPRARITLLAQLSHWWRTTFRSTQSPVQYNCQSVSHLYWANLLFLLPTSPFLRGSKPLELRSLFSSSVASPFFLKYKYLFLSCSHKSLDV